jgi:hypothetical protein
MRQVFATAVMVGLLAGPAMPADILCKGKKVIIIDNLAGGKAKVVALTKDGGCGITKGTSTGTDPSVISASFFYSYQGNEGVLDAPLGVSDGTKGWLVNKDGIAKYVNKDAGVGGDGTKIFLVKPNRRIKVSGRNLGDSPIDILSAGDLTGGSPDLNTSYTITNDGETNRVCSAYDCTFKLIANDTGAKLNCRTPVPGHPCPASPSGAFLD